MKLWMTVLLGLVVLAHAAASAQTNGVPATVDPTEAITRLRDGLIDSFNKGDMDRLLTHLDTNVVVTWQNAEVSKGREAVRQYYNRMMVGENRVVESISAEPVVEGRVQDQNSAISFGQMNDVFKLRDGMEFRLNSRFSAALVRQEGKWVVRGFHASGNVFDNEIQHAIVRKVVTWTAIGVGLAGLALGYIVARLTLGKRVSPRV